MPTDEAPPVDHRLAVPTVGRDRGGDRPARPAGARHPAAGQPPQPAEHGDADRGGRAPRTPRRRPAVPWGSVAIAHHADGRRTRRTRSGPRPAMAGRQAEHGAERDRHDDDAGHERRLVVGAEQRDGQLLQPGGEAVDELGADRRDQRRCRRRPSPTPARRRPSAAPADAAPAIAAVSRPGGWSGRTDGSGGGAEAPAAASAEGVD